jgi:hypothetical protein
MIIERCNLCQLSSWFRAPGTGVGLAARAQRLRKAGHKAITLTLPGLAAGDDKALVQTKDAVNHIIDEFVRRDMKDMTLVAHCLGSSTTFGKCRRA